jgi:hypothetical protein
MPMQADGSTAQPPRDPGHGTNLGMAQSVSTNGPARTPPRAAEPAVRAYLAKMARLRMAERRLQAAAPGSPEYAAAASNFERLTQELMDDFAKAVRSVR